MVLPAGRLSLTLVGKPAPPKPMMPASRMRLMRTSLGVLLSSDSEMGARDLSLVFLPSFSIQRAWVHAELQLL
jgi:hypothetical protein